MSGRRAKRTSQTNEEQPSASKTSKEDNDEIFSKPWKGSNAVLIVEDKELHVHTQTLSQASPVFERMFEGNFIEAQTKRVTLEGKKYDLIEHLLRIIYPFKTRLEPIFSLLCVSCGNKPARKHPSSSRRFNWETCQRCGKEFYKRYTELKATLKHLQALHKLSREYMIDSLAQRIEDHLYLQSLSLKMIDHAFDILETLDIITPSKDFRIQDVRENCARFVSKCLEDIETLNELLKERVNLSLENKTMVMGILLKNVLKKWKPKGDEAEEAKYVASQLAKDFLNAGESDDEIEIESESESD